MHAVPDANVLISAVLSPRGTPARLLLAWQAGAIDLVVSPLLLAGAHGSGVSVHRRLYSHRMLTIAPRLDVMTRLGRAMADPTRSRILLALLEGPRYPARLADELGLTRTNVSNHLTFLRGCGIVVAGPEGRQTRYEIADRHIGAALTAVMNVVLAVDGGRACTAESCDGLACCVVPA